MTDSDETDFLEIVLTNPLVETVLDRAGRLALPDWYLTAGCLLQTVWNVLDGQPPTRGIRDYDLFGLVLTPNPVLAPQEVYEAKVARWQSLWPRLVALPWPEGGAQAMELKTTRRTSTTTTKPTSPAATEAAAP